MAPLVLPLVAEANTLLGFCSLAEPEERVAPICFSSMTLDSPKSATLQQYVAVTRIFDDFRSRWMIFRA